MKLGVNGRTFLDKEPDGAVQTAIELTRRLNRQEDIDVTIYGPESSTYHFEEDINICSIGWYFNHPISGVIWERTVLPYVTINDDIDVLLCPNGNAPAFPLPDVKVMMYIHDINAQKGMSSGVHGGYRKSLVPLGARFADVILTVSEFSKKEISEHLSINDDKIEVVYNGVDDIFFQSGNSEQMELPEDYILYVGAMNPRKNIQTLIEAYEILREKQDINQKLVLIGPSNKKVYKKTDWEKDDDNIITPGFVPQPQLKYAYQNANVFVYPSLYEGFGLPPLEAMACGTPTIASNVTSLPEILGSNAKLINPSNEIELSKAIEDLLTNKDERELFSTNGKSHASKYTWDSATSQILGIINQ